MNSAEAIKAEIENFLSKPSPLWENKLTHLLVEAKHASFSNVHSSDRQSYTTAGALNFSDILPRKQFLASYNDHIIYLEKPDKKLFSFYDEHGLEPLNDRTLIKSKAASKLKSSFQVLNLIPECAACIAELVNCIQVVASEGPEYDTSYTHPDLPFTIFVSVCDDDSLNARFRVAESILHEAMHLKLTLIQDYIELVQPNSTETFFSPWRNVQRPLMGVLHGLFVFRAIQDFFRLIKDDPCLDNKDYNFATYRIDDIATDFRALQHFSINQGLSKDGANLSANLLPSN
jgi:hypothetical protein